MAVQPAFAALEKLLDFVLADPVVLVIVQHWDQHIEVIEQRLQPSVTGEFQGHIGRRLAGQSAAILYRLSLDGPAQRFEELSDQTHAAARRQGRRGPEPAALFVANVERLARRIA